MRIFAFLIFMLNSFSAYTQQMVYIKNGTVSLNDKQIKKPHQLKKVLEQQNSQDLVRMYKRYIWLKRSAQFFSTVAGLGLISAVEDEFGPKPKINWPSVGVAVGASITAELFHRPSNRALKEIVERYNEEIYFQPVMRNKENW